MATIIAVTEMSRWWGWGLGSGGSTCLIMTQAPDAACFAILVGVFTAFLIVARALSQYPGCTSVIACGKRSATRQIFC